MDPLTSNSGVRNKLSFGAKVNIKVYFFKYISTINVVSPTVAGRKALISTILSVPLLDSEPQDLL